MLFPSDASVYAISVVMDFLDTQRRPIRHRRAIVVLIVALVACALLVTTGAPSQPATPTAAGQLYAFGSNLFGELGNATNSVTNKANPTPTLVRLSGATGAVTAAAAGSGFSLVVTATGQRISRPATAARTRTTGPAARTSSGRRMSGRRLAGRRLAAGREQLSVARLGRPRDYADTVAAILSRPASRI